MARHERPNILVLCTDQHRYDALACYGNPVLETPAIDRLAAEGALFERCYTPSPICSPARASMLTGQFPHVHGLWANGVSLPGSPKLLGRILADAGYDCGIVGKLHLSAGADGRTEPRHDDGFRVYKWSMTPSHQSPDNSYHHWLAKRFPELWKQQLAETDPKRSAEGHVLRPGEDMPTEAHYTRWIADETIEFLREERDTSKPFFYFANFFDPHHPFLAPPEYLERYRGRELPPAIRGPLAGDDKPAIQAQISAGRVGLPPGFLAYSDAEMRDIAAAYYAMVSFIDDEIARIMQVLKDLELDDDTLVILTSDHGEMLGDHAQILKGPFFYEGAVRVPLILRWPRRIRQGSRPQDLVETLDLFATCLAAAGIEQPGESQAIDLVPIANGDSSAARSWALCEYRNSGFPIDPPVIATMLRTDQYKVVVHHAGERERTGELYDLVADPQENFNRWNDPEFAEVRRELTEQLLDVLVETENRASPREAPW